MGISLDIIGLVDVLVMLLNSSVDRKRWVIDVYVTCLECVYVPALQNHSFSTSG